MYQFWTFLLATCPYLPATYYDRDETMIVRQQGRDVVALRGSNVLPFAMGDGPEWRMTVGRLGEDGRSLHTTSGFRSVGTVFDNCTIRWDVNTTWDTVPPKKEEVEYSYDEEFPFDEDEYDDDRWLSPTQFSKYVEVRMREATELMMELLQDMQRQNDP